MLTLLLLYVWDFVIVKIRYVINSVMVLCTICQLMCVTLPGRTWDIMHPLLFLKLGVTRMTCCLYRVCHARRAHPFQREFHLQHRFSRAYKVHAVQPSHITEPSSCSTLFSLASSSQIKFLCSCLRKLHLSIFPQAVIGRGSCLQEFLHSISSLFLRTKDPIKSCWLAQLALQD